MYGGAREFLKEANTQPSLLDSKYIQYVQYIQYIHTILTFVRRCARVA